MSPHLPLHAPFEGEPTVWLLGMGKSARKLLEGAPGAMFGTLLWPPSAMFSSFSLGAMLNAGAGICAKEPRVVERGRGVR